MLPQHCVIPARAVAKETKFRIVVSYCSTSCPGDAMQHYLMNKPLVFFQILLKLETIK